MAIPVIDLFAGPGGLGEGFSSLDTDRGDQPFSVRLSIEKDPFAHRTLEMRSFFRQFNRGMAPDDYYAYCRGELSRNELFDRFPAESTAAQREAWLAELGKVPPQELDSRISEALDGRLAWVLIGGPPCQAYSVVGRSRMKSDTAKFESDDRHFLYKEYLRILRRFAPPVFLMENVQGLLSSKVRGEEMFQRILRDLRRKTSTSPGYDIFSLVRPGESRRLEPLDFLVRFEEYGIPQSRHRVILLGIRRDLPKDYGFLERASDKPSVDDAIRDLPRIRSCLSQEEDSYAAWKAALADAATFDWGPYGRNAEFRMRVQSAVQRARYEATGSDGFFARDNTSLTYPSAWLTARKQWFIDPRLAGGALNHGARAHVREDLLRYLFASVYGELNGVSPRLRDFPESLLPKHTNVPLAMGTNFFADRFRVQLRTRAATTVVSHMAKDGHSYIHPDPEQCRSLTVREAARLQTFPDNYFFEGPRTQQYRQVGNAVPPLFARAVADRIHAILTNVRPRLSLSNSSPLHGLSDAE